MYHFKDRNPQETVKLFKSKLNELGLTFTESNLNEVIDGVWSVTVICNEAPKLCSNGKGLSRDLCLASAYGELVELIDNFPEVHLNWINDIGGFRLFPDEIIHTDFDRVSKDVVNDIIELNNGNSDLSDCALKDSEFIETKFYDYFEDKYEYLPINTILRLNDSNGSSAGNTYEEACVEAISEIFERYAYRKIFEDKLTPPEIDRYYLSEKCPDLFEKIILSEANLGTEIKVYDCSLGLGYPVLCMVSYDRKSHTYKSKLGSHPLFEVALERCITEYYQNFSDFIYKETNETLNEFAFIKSNTFSPITESFVFGFQIFPPEFFKSESSWTFEEWKDIEGYSNKKGFDFLLDVLKRNNKKVYIKDTDWLGLSSVCVYVPTVSFIRKNYSLLEDNNNRLYQIFLNKLIHNKDLEDIKKLNFVIGYYLSGSSTHCIYDFYLEHDLLIHLCLRHRQYESALNVINSVSYSDDFYDGLKMSILLLKNDYDFNDISDIIKKFYSYETSNRILNMFSSEGMSQIYVDNRKVGIVTNYSKSTLNEEENKRLILKIKNKMSEKYKENVNV